MCLSTTGACMCSFHRMHVPSFFYDGSLSPRVLRFPVVQGLHVVSYLLKCMFPYGPLAPGEGMPAGKRNDSVTIGGV
jgi:hypothetical protein